MSSKKKNIDMRYITYEKDRDDYLVTLPQINGKRGPKRRFKDLMEAIRFRDENVPKLKMSLIKIDPNTTVKGWLEDWLNNYCDNFREKTRQDYASLIKKHCQPLYPLKVIGGIKPYDIDNVLKQMRNAGVATSTIKRTFAALCSAFRCIQKKQLYAYDILPTAGCEIPDESSTLKKPRYYLEPAKAYPEHVLASLVSAARVVDKRKVIRNKWLCIIKLLRLTGMRLSECLGICKKDLKFYDDRVVIHLQQSVHDVSKELNAMGLCWSVEGLKSKASYRDLPIFDAELIYLLKDLCGISNATIKYGEVSYDFLFSTKNGTPILHSNFYRMFNKIRKIAKTTIRPHEIRHSVATILSHRKDISYADAASFLGHTLEVYLRYYVHSDNSSSIAISRILTPLQQQDHIINESTSLYTIDSVNVPKMYPNDLLFKAS